MTCDFFLLKQTSQKKKKMCLDTLNKAALTAPLLQPFFFLSTTQLNITTVLLRPRVTGRNYLVYSAQLLAGIYSHSWKCEHVWHPVKRAMKTGGSASVVNFGGLDVEGNSLDCYHKCHPIRNKQSCQLLSMHAGGVPGLSKDLRESPNTLQEIRHGTCPGFELRT